MSAANLLVPVVGTKTLKAAKHTKTGETKGEEHRRRKYGLTPEQYTEILDSQGGVCAVGGCGNPATDVDHDHKCCPPRRACDFCLRGLLCFRCNRALGFVKDSPVILRALIDYLESYPAVRPPQPLPKESNLMTYEEIHERLARLTDIVDIPKIEALRDRISAGRVAVEAARFGGHPDAYCAPAEAKLAELADDLSRMEVNALTPFKVALGLTMVADDLAAIALPKGSVISASIPGVCDWTVTVGLDVIPF